MHLVQVRKGQFVYYKNELHKVYSVKPFFRKSVHLVRIKDYHQVLAQAKEIDLYKPQHLDSFICHFNRYTLHKNREPEIGDFILVINPSPDYLDSHYLNAIEMVAAIESNGVITDKSNGIKHNEYWVMAPGKLEGANIIDLQQPNGIMEYTEEDDQTVTSEIYIPQIGDIYQKNDSDPVIQAMDVAIKEQTVLLGGGFDATIE